MADKLKTNEKDLPERIDQILHQQKEMKKEVEKMKKELASSDLESNLSQVKESNGIQYITGVLDGVDGENLRNLAEQTRNKQEPIVVVLASVLNEKVLFACAVSKALTKQIQAGKLIGQVAKIAGGGGGGRPDFAQAGGKDPSKVQEALDAVEGLLGQ